MSEANRRRSGRALPRPLALGVALAGALFAAAAPTQAQQTRSDSVRRERMDPEQQLERRVQMLAERLDLTDAQANDVRTLFRQEAEHMRAAFAEAGIEPPERPAPRGQARRRERGERERLDADQREALRDAMEEVRAETDEGLARILTAQQLEQYRALEQQRRERMEERGPRGRRGR